MRGVGGDDRVALLAAVREVRAHEHEAGELALRAGRRLERDGGKPGDLGEDLLESPHELERALRALVLLVRMKIAEAGEPCQPLVDARVVLHRAGAERVEAGVDAEGAVGERREVAHDLRLGDLGKARGRRPCEPVRKLGNGQVGPRRTPGAASGTGALEDQRRVVSHAQTSSSTSARRSTSSTVRFSVSATSRTSSIPS